MKQSLGYALTRGIFHLIRQVETQEILDFGGSQIRDAQLVLAMHSY